MTTETLKAYKFRIYPNEDQRSMLNQTFGCVRFLWNKLTENFINYSESTIISEKILKKTGEIPWLNDISAGALQQKQRDFIETKKQFFNKKRKIKLGVMKFKKKGMRDSYRLPNQKFKLDQNNSTLRLEKIGQVSIVLDRIIPDDANYRSVTISKTSTNKYFASVLVKININNKPLTGRIVGIDLGLKDLFTVSCGMKIDNPRWFRENQSKLKKAQKHLSRKIKGSNRRKKSKLKVARIHDKIKNCREYFHHVFSTAIVDTFDVVCVEDLNISGMKQGKLSKSVSDAGWSEFIRQLKYKCEWYGKTFMQIDRFFPSSKICSECGYKNEELTLKDRNWSCSECHAVHDRDLNASRNILKEGRRILTSAELVDYRHGEEVSLIDDSHHLASSVKCLG